MSTAVADPHQRVRRAVADAAATMAAFGGPERAEIGWEEVRAVWAAGPRNGRPTPWDAWAGESERVPLSRKGQPQRVPDFDVIDSIMEPYNLLEDLLTSCDCHNNGEQPKKVGDACGDGYVDEVYGWEYYGGNCWFKYRCRDKDKCRCHSLEEALSAAGVRLSDLDDAIGHGACGAKYPGRVEKPGWALCGGRNARLVWDAETESCAVELDCFPDQSATDACDVDGSARISLGADALTKCTVGSRTTEYWPTHKGVCDDLAVDPSKVLDNSPRKPGSGCDETRWAALKTCMINANIWGAIEYYYLLEPLDFVITCRNTPWILYDPAYWPPSVRQDLEKQCDYQSRLSGGACGVVDWKRWSELLSSLSDIECGTIWRDEYLGRPPICRTLRALDSSVERECQPHGGPFGRKSNWARKVADDFANRALGDQ